MNQLQTQKRRNDTARHFRPMNRREGGLYWGSGETDDHILMKLEICKHLKREGKQFYTEAILMDGNRADVVNLDDGVIYEVVESETEKSLLRKIMEYPLRVIIVYAGQPFDEKMIQ